MKLRRTVTFWFVAHGDTDRYPSLPMQVIDGSDRVILQQAIDTTHPFTTTIEGEDDEPMVARLQLPTGKSVVKSLWLNGIWQSDINFEVGFESPHEWMAWSTMRVDLSRQVPPLMEQPGMADAWLQLWELDSEKRRWNQISLPVEAMEHDFEGRQIELAPSSRPRALVARLGEGTPQVISLPTQCNSTLLLTRAHALPGSDSAQILVGGYGLNAEGVLEFLRRGSLDPAGRVLDPGSALANELLYGKVTDPLAATAAAYYLFRKRDWEQMPQQWLENLASWFDWIPDAILLRDASRIQRGVSAKVAPGLAARCLKAALGHGLPFFAEARWLLEDLLLFAVRATGTDGLTTAQRTLVRGVLAGFQPAGLSFGFYGRAPDKPVSAEARSSAAQGMERRLKQVGHEVIALNTLAALMSPTVGGDFARGLETATKGLEVAVAALNAMQSSGRLGEGSATKTLFVRDIIWRPRAYSTAPIQASNPIGGAAAAP